MSCVSAKCLSRYLTLFSGAVVIVVIVVIDGIGRCSFLSSNNIGTEDILVVSLLYQRTEGYMSRSRAAPGDVDASDVADASGLGGTNSSAYLCSPEPSQRSAASAARITSIGSRWNDLCFVGTAKLYTFQRE
jgi:hypothetical protein